MLSAKMRKVGSAEEEDKLWSASARDWAETQERTAEAAYEAVLNKTRTDSRVRLLDIGCGAGTFCAEAARRGAIVNGLDAAAALIAIARERMPHGDFRVGEMEDLPFSDQSFDLVTAFNSIQYARDPLNALQEVRRVSRIGGQAVVATWGSRDNCDMNTYLAALERLAAPSRPSAGKTFSVSSDSVASLVSQAGLAPAYSDDVECIWDYADLETALKGILSAGPTIKAIQVLGREKVKQVVADAIAPFRQSTGGYQLKNQCHYVIAIRPQ